MRIELKTYLGNNNTIITTINFTSDYNYCQKTFSQIPNKEKIKITMKIVD